METGANPITDQQHKKRKTYDKLSGDSSSGVAADRLILSKPSSLYTKPTTIIYIMGTSGGTMKKLACSIAAVTMMLASGVTLAQLSGPAERAYPDGFITGTVTSSSGPEAGVWVIAETKETNTPFIKIVVTDDDGKFTLPQLPT